MVRNNNEAKEQEQDQKGVVEVVIDLTLINNKLNYIISKLEKN